MLGVVIDSVLPVALVGQREAVAVFVLVINVKLGALEVELGRELGLQIRKTRSLRKFELLGLGLEGSLDVDDGGVGGGGGQLTLAVGGAGALRVSIGRTSEGRVDNVDDFLAVAELVYSERDELRVRNGLEDRTRDGVGEEDLGVLPHINTSKPISDIDLGPVGHL